MSENFSADIEKITTFLTALSEQQWLSVQGRGYAIELTKELQGIVEEMTSFVQFVQQTRLVAAPSGNPVASPTATPLSAAIIQFSEQEDTRVKRPVNYPHRPI